MDTGIVLAILGGIGVGLGLVWKYFTDQDAKKTEIILKQVDEAKAIAEEERKRADLIRNDFIGALAKVTDAVDRSTKVNTTSLNKRDKVMEEHLKALQDLSDTLKQLAESSNKERSE